MDDKVRYLKLLAVVEEDFRPIAGKIEFENEEWKCENVLSIKLNDDFMLPEDLEKDFLETVKEKFIETVLELSKKRSRE
jgi:hypothetical protein